MDAHTLQINSSISDQRAGKVMCPYCGVGCLMDVVTRANRVVELVGSPEAPANYGKLCPKGALAGSVLELSGRLLAPKYNPHRGGDWIDISWDSALTQLSTRLRDIIDRYGPESVALYGSGQLDTESWYLGNKLF